MYFCLCTFDVGKFGKRGIIFEYFIQVLAALLLQSIGI